MESKVLEFNSPSAIQRQPRSVAKQMTFSYARVDALLKGAESRGVSSPPDKDREEKVDAVLRSKFASSVQAKVVPEYVSSLLKTKPTRPRY